MDKDDLLNFVKETVEDEQRIVTYKWLSKTKNISMNEAKTVLQDFVTAGLCSGLTVYLCVVGFKNCDTKKMCVEIVRSDEKERALKEYSDSTFHVYSVQRTNTEASLLYSCDYDISKKFSLGDGSLLAIRRDNVTVRSYKKVPEQHPNPAPLENKVEVQRKVVTSSDTTRKFGLSSFFQKRNVSQSSTASDSADSGFKETENSNEVKDSHEFNKMNSNNSHKINESNTKSGTNARKKSQPAAKDKMALPVEKGKRKRPIVESSSSGSESSEDCDVSQDLFDSSPTTCRTHLGSRLSPSIKSLKSPMGDENLESQDQKEAKENQNINNGMNMIKIQTIKTYMDDDDEEGFMTTKRVTEVVRVSVSDNKGTKQAPKKPIESAPRPEATKKTQAGKKKAAPIPAKQSTISSFFTKK